MRTAVLWLSVFALAATMAQPTEGPRREGGYWVQTVSSTAPLAGAVRLRVSSPGDLTVRGETHAQLSYRLGKRVRAPDEEAARRYLGQIFVETTRRGPWLELAVRAPHDAEARPSLWLGVPRGLREIQLHCQSGGVRATGLQGRLRVQSAAGAVTIEEVDGSIEVQLGGGSIRLSRVRGSVRCFSGGGTITAQDLGAGAELLTAGGEIVVRGGRGFVRASTGGGNIRVEGAPSVSASTAGGSIEIADVPGPTVAESGAGNIRIRQAGHVRARSGSGRIHLEGVAGPVHAATNYGDLVVAFRPGVILHDSELQTAAGDITVFLPSDISVSLEAQAGAEHAAVLSEFGGIATRRIPAGVEARGNLNGGGPRLRLYAPGGSIYVRRAGQPAPGSLLPP